MHEPIGLTVTTPTDRQIVLERVFDAPRQLVYDAFTKPELLVRWFGARGWRLIDCEVDLRVGGSWRFVSRGPGSARMGQGGVYRVIRPPDRLVYTEMFDNQSYPGETAITHEFVDWENRTRVTSTLLYATREGRDAVLKYPMKRGVGESYDRLDAVLKRRPS
jgi:uncharacterized protein YndB with AHSA1/START domain